MTVVATLTFMSLWLVGSFAAPAADTYYGGAGDGSDYGDSSAVQLDTLTAVTTITSLIRAGQTINTISRSSNTVSVALDDDYPNDNLVVGQSIVIDGVEGFNGTFTIATVTDQSNFTYAETADDATGITDDDSTAGGHYTTLTSWEADRQGDITATARNTIEVAECYNDWATGLDDNLELAGWTTDSTHYVKVYTPASERHDRTAGTGFRLKCPDGASVYAISIASGSGYTVIQGLEIIGPDTPANGGRGISNGATETVISDNIIHGFDYNNTTNIATFVGPNYIYRNIIYDGGSTGILNDSGGEYYIYNNVIHDMGVYGIRMRRTTYVYNNTIYNCGTGIITGYDTAYTVKNNLCIDNATADYNLALGTITASNNISSDDTAPGDDSLTDQTLDDIKFVSLTEGYLDFRIQPDSSAVDAGVDLSGTFIDDVDGHIRTGWDVGADEAAAEFVCAIRASGETNPAPDYNKLSDWEDAVDAIDYTLNTTMVFSGTKTGTVADGATVELYRGGADQNIDAVAVHAGASQILVKSISPAPTAGDTFQSGDQWRVSDSEDNMYTISDAGDTVVLVAECYNDWPSGLDDYLIINWGGSYAEALYSDLQHGIIVRTPLSERHDGTAGSGFYLKPTGATECGIIAVLRPVRGIKIQGIEVDGSSTTTADIYGIFLWPWQGKSSGLEVSDCLVHGTSGTNTGLAGIRIVSGQGGNIYNVKIYNNIIYDMDMLGMRYSINDNGYIYNNTIYNFNLQQSVHGYGIRSDSGGKGILKNNIVIGQYSPVDFYGTFHADSDYNLSSDDTAPGAHSLKSSNLDPDASGATEFVDIEAGSEDLHLKAGANAIDAGTDLRADDYIRFDTDIDGDTRYASWEIGADETTFDITVSGTAYATDETTPLTGTARTVHLRVNGTLAGTGDGGTGIDETDTTTGAFSFTSLTLSAGDTITLYLDGETETANTVTIAAGDSASITGVSLMDDHVILRSDNGSTAITIADLVDWDNSDDATDMLFTATAGVLTVDDGAELYINSGDTFTPGGDVTVGTGGLDLNGTWDETGTETTTISGDFDATGGAWTYDTGELGFTSAASPSLTMGGITLYDLELACTGHTSYEELLINGTVTVTNDLILTDGAIRQGTDGNIQVHGNITVAAACGGKYHTVLITVNGTGDQSLTSSGGIMPALTISKTTGTLTLVDDAIFHSNLTYIHAADTFNAGTNKVTLLGNSSANPTLDADGITFYDLEVNHSAHNTYNYWTVAGTITVTNDLILTDGNINQGTGCDIQVYGDITVTELYGAKDSDNDALITLTGGNTQTITSVAGSVMPTLTINKTSGTGASTSGPVNLYGALTITEGTLALGGDTTFNGGVTVEDGGTLACTTPGTTITIDAGDTVTVDSGGLLKMVGASGAGNFVYLDPDADSNWNLVMNGGYYVDYVDVNYSNASGNTDPIVATNSQETSGYSETNTNWTFATEGATITWDGSASTAWNDPDNWSINSSPAGRIPMALDDVVITNQTNDPVIPAGSYTFNSLDVQTGAELTCAGDTTAINAASGGTADAPHGEGVTFNITSSGASAVVVTGTITADEQGFKTGATSPCASTNGGGSHGGKHSGWSYLSGTVGDLYGSVTQPTALGSASSASCDGGGAIKINAPNGTVTVNGTVSSDGQDASWRSAAGGSVWIIADVLAGSGTISADAGACSSGCGGGGGRLAVSYTSTTYTGIFSVEGNAGGGTPGTFSFPDNTNLTVSDGSVASTSTTLATRDIALASGTYNIPTLTITDNATLYCHGDPDTESTTGLDDGSGVIINSTTITVDTGSTISADAYGFKWGNGPGYSDTNCGGTYGGDGSSNTTSTYGSAVQPLSLGSGGDSNEGGGAIKLNVSGTLTVNGTISVDGRGGHRNGSGGSVWIIVDTFAGTNSDAIITAEGGSGQYYPGGGGRVAVYYGSTTYAGSVSVAGGVDTDNDPAGNAEAGTIVYTPIGGYTAENVIPTAQCEQSTDGDGVVTVTFKVKDPGDEINDSTTQINDNHYLDSFEYSVEGGAEGTWNSSDEFMLYGGCSYYKTVTIDATKVAADLTDFPMLFSVTDNDLKQTPNGHVQNENGYDIAFSDASGTELDHEIVEYNGTTGEFIAWVKIPTLKGSEDTTIYLYYGDSNMTTSFENAVGVWNNYAGVWHMDDNAADTTVTDSIGNSNGTAQQNTDQLDATGKVGGALTFNGTSDYISITNGAHMDFTTESFSIFVWAYPNTNDAGVIYDNRYNISDTDLGWIYGLYGDGKIVFDINGDSDNDTTLSSASSYAATAWQLIGVVKDGTTGYFYVDGQLVDTLSLGSSGTITYSESYLFHNIGKVGGAYYDHSYDIPNRYFAGTIDEVHISSTARSAEWILTSYNNQNDPGIGGFIKSVGSETGREQTPGKSCLSGSYWSSSYTGASTFAGASDMTFTFDTTCVGLTGLDGVAQDDVQIRFKVKDTITQDDDTWYISSEEYATSESFTVDNAAPSGLADFVISNTAATNATLTWTAATDTNFGTYEISYGTNLTDVEGRTGTATVIDKDTAGYSALGTATTATIDVTSITWTAATWYFKIWAKDDYGNEATTAHDSVIGTGTVTWDGDTDTNWHTDANWDGGAVPGAGSDVVIPSGALSYLPALGSATTVGSLTISGNSLTCNANLAVLGAISVAGTLELNGITINNTGGTFSNTGTLKLHGGETFTGFTNDPNSGTVEYVGNGDSSDGDVVIIKEFGTTPDYFNLTINSTDANDIFRTDASSPLDINGDFILTNGTFDNATNDNAISVAGNVTADCDQVDMGDATWSVGGNVDFKDVTTFNDDASTLTMSGATKTLTGAVGKNLNNVNITGTVTLSADTDTSQRVDGTLTVSGTGALTVSELLEIAGDLKVQDTGSVTGGDVLTILDTASISEKASGAAIDTATFNIMGAHNANIAAAQYDSATVNIKNDTSSAKIFTSKSGTYTFTNNVTISTADTGGLTILNSTNDANFIFQGNVALTEDSGTITYTKGAGAITLSGGGAADDTINFLDKAVEDITVNDADGGTKKFTDGWTADSFSGTAGTANFNGQAVETTGDFTIGTGGQTVGTGFNGSSLTVGGDLSLTGESDDLLDMAAGASWTLDVTGSATASYVDAAYCDASGGTEIDAVDNCTDSGNNTNWDIAKPIGGYSADNVIPTAQCVQSTDASGVVTITFRVKDADADIGTDEEDITLNTFEYSINGGGDWYAPTTNGDLSGALSSGWTNNSGSNYVAATDWSGTEYSFTFDADHTDINGLSGARNTTVQIRFTVNDGNYDSVSPATSQNFEVDDAPPTGLANLAVDSVTSTTATMTWTAATDHNFNHYEIWYGTTEADVQSRSAGAGAAEWDEDNDADLATATTATTTITGLSAGETYYFKIWAIDDYGNESTDPAGTGTINELLNNPPLGGWTADNIIPAAQCTQSSLNDGKVTIWFRVKDANLNACTLNTFQYKVGAAAWAAPTNGDASLALSTNWEDYEGSGYASATDWAGTQYFFKFDTDHADVTGMADAYNNDIRIRFLVNDGHTDSAAYATSAEFVVDNVDPTGLADLAVDSTTATTAVMSWTAASDDTTADFDYEIWYGEDSGQVNTKTYPALAWNVTDDADMADITTTGTTITGLSAGTEYYFKIWAKDKYGNFMSFPTDPISAETTGNLTNEAITPASTKAGATSNYTIAFTTDNAIDIGGDVRVTFDSDFDITGAAYVSGTSVADVSKSGQTLIMTLGTTVGADTGVSIVVSGIVNPTVTETVDDYVIYTKDSEGSFIDAGSASGTTIATNDLSSLSAAPLSTKAGDTTTYTTAFTTFNPIPTAGYIRITFDDDFDISGATFEASSSVDASIESKTGNVVLVKLDAGVSVNAATAVSLVISGLKNPEVTQTTDAYTIETEDTSNAGVDTGNAAGTSITTGDLVSPTITSPTYVAGDDSANYTIAFTTANPIPQSGDIQVTFDSDYDLSSADYESGNTNATVSYSSNVLTINLGTAVSASSAVSIVVSGIKNPVVTETTDDFSIETQNASDVAIDEGTASGVTITTGALTSPTVTASTYVAGDSSEDYTIAFTSANPIPADGDIQVTFDSDYDLSGAAYVSGNADSTVSYSSNVLTINLGTAVSASSAVSIVVSGIKNPTVTQTTDDFAIQTEDASDVDIDTGTASGVTITTGSITNSTVTSPTYVAGDDSESYTIAFTTENPIESGGDIVVTFDSAYDLTGTLAVVGTSSHTATVADSGVDLIISLTEDAASAASVSMVISGIKNPPVTETTDDFDILTRDASDASIDTGTASGVKITTGTLTSASIVSELGTYPAGNSAQAYIIQFTTDNPIPVNGHVRVTFDSDYDISGASYDSVNSNVDGNIVSKTGSVLLVNLDEVSVVGASTAVLIYIDGIKNPGSTQTTDNYTIETEDTSANSYADIDTGVAPGNTITVGDLTGVSVEAASTKAGDTTSYTIGFTTTSLVPVNGDVEVTFDSDYDLTGTLAVESGNSGATVSDSGDTLIINLGTQIEASSAASIVVSGIVNPSVTGQVDNNIVTTENDEDNDIDTGTATGETITTNDLTDESVTALSYTASATTTYTFAFTTFNPVLNDGFIRITFDSDYNIVSAAYDASSNIDGNIVSTTSNILLINLDESLTAEQSVSVVITGIVNPEANQTTDGYVIQTENPSQTAIDAVTADGNDIAGELVSENVQAVSLAAGATTSYTTTFTTAGAAPQGSSITITFDSDYDISGATFSASSNFSGSIASTSENILKININESGGFGIGEGVSLVVTGIENPPYAQDTDDFTIRTRTSGDTIIDSGSAGGLSITEGAITPTVTATSAVAGATTNYTIAFTATNAIPDTGKIQVALDSDYDLTGTLAVDGSSTHTATVDDSGDNLVITMTEAVSGSASVSMVITGIENPAYCQTVTKPVVTTIYSDGTSNIDTGTATNDTIVTAGTLTSLTVNTVSGTYKAGITEDYTIAFTTDNPIPVGGRIRVTFDSDYDLSAGAYSSGNAESSVSYSDNVLIITLGTAVNADTAVSIVVSGIRNPTTLQTTTAASITTRYNDAAPGTTIDEGTANAHDIVRYITVTSPVSTDEWGVADPTKVITWDNGGDINEVDIYYSTTGTFTGEEVVIVTNYSVPDYSPSESASYTWSNSGDGIPDLVDAAGDPQTDPAVSCWIQVRDSVSGHATLSDVSDEFDVVYYTITWNVKDMSTGSYLTGLNVNEINSSSVNTWSITDNSLNAPGLTRNYKYDTYTTTWAKENYFDTSEAAWTADSSKAIELFMETTIEKQWFVFTTYSYDAASDRLNMNVWIEKEGELMTAPTSMALAITNSAGNAVTGSPFGSGLTADSNGVFWTSVDTSGWTSGEVYFAKTSVVYGGATYTSGEGIAISVDKQLETIRSTVVSEAAEQDTYRTATTATLTTIETATTGTGTGTIRGEIAGVKTVVDDVQTKAASILSNVDTEVAAILQDTSTTLPAQIRSDVVDTMERGVLTEILTRNTSIREDETITIRYRTATGLAPTITIYDADGEVLSDYDGVDMEEISATGIYEYDVTAESDYGTGDFTVVCEETTNNSTDSMVLSVKALYVAGGGVEESIDSLGYAVTKVYEKSGAIEEILGETTDDEDSGTVFGLVSDIEDTIDNLGLTTVANDARNAKAKALEAANEINTVTSKISNIETQVIAMKSLMGNINEMKSELARVYAGIREKEHGDGFTAADREMIRARLMKLPDGTETGLEGELAKEKAEVLATEAQVKDLQNKIEQATAMIKLMKGMVESTSNKPVVEGWFEKK